MNDKYSMNYATEFSLISCKIIFRIDDATAEELEIYHKHPDFKHIENCQDLFLPFEGEERSFYDPNFGTQKLRIRYWIWQYGDIDYELVDINSWWPQETGVIGIKTKKDKNFTLLAINDDSWINLIIDHVFESRVDFFSSIRFLCELDDCCSYDDEIINAEVEKFIQSDAGQKASSIELEAQTLYQNKYNIILTERIRLKNLYLSEFKIVETRVNPDSDFLNAIGYLQLWESKPSNQARVQLWDENLGNPHVSYLSLEWNYDNNTYKLIYINDLDDNDRNLYLIINGSLIEVFHDWFLSEKNRESRTPLIYELHHRIHSIKYLCLNYNPLMSNLFNSSPSYTDPNNSPSP